MKYEIKKDVLYIHDRKTIKYLITDSYKYDGFLVLRIKKFKWFKSYDDGILCAFYGLRIIEATCRFKKRRDEMIYESLMERNDIAIIDSSGNLYLDNDIHEFLESHLTMNKLI